MKLKRTILSPSLKILQEAFRAREQEGLTRGKLARQLEISVNHMNRILDGVTMPNGDLFLRIAGALGVKGKDFAKLLEQHAKFENVWDQLSAYPDLKQSLQDELATYLERVLQAFKGSRKSGTLSLGLSVIFAEPIARIQTDIADKP